MIKKFEKFTYESQDLDPYGEEDWEPGILERYLNLLESMMGVSNLNLNLEYNGLTFSIDYPNRGLLRFAILKLNYSHGRPCERVELYFDSGKKLVSLEECTEKELWNKITYLVDGVKESHELDPYGEEDWEDTRLIDILISMIEDGTMFLSKYSDPNYYCIENNHYTYAIINHANESGWYIMCNWVKYMSDDVTDEDIEKLKRLLKK